MSSYFSDVPRPALAPSGGWWMSAIPPLLRDKQTSIERARNDASDPLRTSSLSAMIATAPRPALEVERRSVANGGIMAIVTACVLQGGTVGFDTEATLAKAESLIAEAGRIGARIAVLPEGFIGGYPKGADFRIFLGARTPEGREEFRHYFEAAISVPGPATERLGRAARTANLFLTAGVIERDGGTLYCSALFFGPDGALLGKHRKLMPTALERLCWGFGDGSTLTAVPTPWGTLGAVICWENYMPLMRMAMYAKGLAFYCAPTADDRDTWAATMTHIALEGRCFVLSACQYLTRANFPDGLHNRLGNDADRVLMRGGSLIVSPLGRVLAGPLWNEEGVLSAELDTDEITRSKIDFDAVGHYARPDIFRLEVDERPMPAVRNRQAVDTSV